MKVVRAEINTAKTLVRRHSAFEFETAIEKLKEHKSPGIDKIAAKLTTVQCKKFYYEIHKLINCISSKEELPELQKLSIIVLI